VTQKIKEKRAEKKLTETVWHPEESDASLKNKFPTTEAEGSVTRDRTKKNAKH